jgi:serine/threonine protein kinase
MSNTVHALLIGRTLARKYAIEELIGSGGMGAVYRARQVALDKWVAVKVLHREMAGEPKFVARFKREALSASRLDHPNSLRVLDFGEDQGLLYLVMEYVEAEDLLSILDRAWPLETERIVSVVSQTLAALGVAHDLGIVHRDIKPENILVEAGVDDDGLPTDVIKVCDFGVAKLAPRGAGDADSFSPRLTVDGLAIGTPDYMSPEQARGEAVDGRSDLYSVGVVLYRMLAGRAPFISDSALGVALQHVTDEPPPPSRFADVHPGLEAICLRALAKRPADRFQTAREMRRALRGAQDETRASSSSVPPLVVTQPGFTTRRLGSNSPADFGASVARPNARTPRRPRARLRQAVAAAAGGALVAMAIAASPTLAQHTIEPLVAKHFGRLDPAPTVATWVPDRASVDVAGVQTSPGVSEHCVRVALERASLATCYREALRRRNAPVPLETALELGLDPKGRVISSSLSRDAALPGLRSCIESELLRADVCDVDTEDGVATALLNFAP